MGLLTCSETSINFAQISHKCSTKINGKKSTHKKEKDTRLKFAVRGLADTKDLALIDTQNRMNSANKQPSTSSTTVTLTIGYFFLCKKSIKRKFAGEIMSKLFCLLPKGSEMCI